MDAVPTIVIAIDGLRASALGAYGQTAYETPALDALAAESRAYEWAYAPTPEPADLSARIAGFLPTGGVLVTDDAAATRTLALKFGRVIEIEPAAPSEPADSIDATTTAATWAAMAEAIVEANNAGALFVWLHTRGLYGPWDAPAELMQSLLDEDDPEVVSEIAPPDVETDEPDERFAASCRYAAQVMTLDACLGGWLDIVAGLYEGEDYRLVALGLRGFPLGEHGRIGGVDARLFSEQQHAPLLVREPDANARFDRCAAPLTLDAALATLLSGAEPQSGPVCLSSPTARAMITSEWMLRLPDGDAEAAELYVKPDDRWDQNDVASLEGEAAAKLLAAMAPGADSGVVSAEADL